MHGDAQATCVVHHVDVFGFKRRVDRRAVRVAEGEDARWVRGLRGCHRLQAQLHQARVNLRDEWVRVARDGGDADIFHVTQGRVERAPQASVA